MGVRNTETLALFNKLFNHDSVQKLVIVNNLNYLCVLLFQCLKNAILQNLDFYFEDFN